MCDPFTMIAATLSAGGSLLGGAGSMAAGKARSRSASIQAWVDESNADLARRSGAFEAGRIREQADAAADQARGFYAAGGIDPGFGGPAFAQAWSEAQGATDAGLAIARGAGEGAQHALSAAGHLSEAGDARRAGRLSMASSILSAGSTMFAALGKGGAAPGGGGMAGAAAKMTPGDPFNLRWGYTGAQPSFWHR